MYFTDLFSPRAVNSTFYVLVLSSSLRGEVSSIQDQISTSVFPHLGTHNTWLTESLSEFCSGFLTHFLLHKYAFHPTHPHPQQILGARTPHRRGLHTPPSMPRVEQRARRREGMVVFPLSDSCSLPLGRGQLVVKVRVLWSGGGFVLKRETGTLGRGLHVPCTFPGSDGS